MKALLAISSAFVFTAFMAQEQPEKKTGDEPVLSMELNCSIQGKYRRAVTKQTAYEARLISDIIPGFPSNWISEYVSVEIKTIRQGIKLSEKGTNGMLTEAQCNLLKTADLGNDVFIHIQYKYNDGVIDYTENRDLNVTLTVVPDAEAEFVGGTDKLREYVKENITRKISQSVPDKFQKGSVQFTVNEEGKIVNAKMVSTSGDLNTDHALIELVNKMPAWKPAENVNGLKVKQDFVLNVGNSGGC